MTISKPRECEFAHQTMCGDWKCTLQSTYDEAVYCDGDPEEECEDYKEKKYASQRNWIKVHNGLVEKKE